MNGTDTDEVVLSDEHRRAMVEALFAEQRRTHPWGTCCFSGSDADLVEAYTRLRETRLRETRLRETQRQARLDGDRQVDELEEVEP